MIAFDPHDPFPLLPEGSHSYAEAQEHAAEVDRWLGLEMDGVEEQLRAKYPEKPAPGTTHALWVGLPLKTLLTPYLEIRQILALLAPKAGETVVDLGAAYGRMGFVLARHHPGVAFTGYEKAAERVTEGNRRYQELALSHAGPGAIRLIEADLASPSFEPQAAPFYFIYDYSVPGAIEKTLQDLRKLARSGKITVVGRGRSSRQIIERSHPWLSEVVAPEHHGNFSIYRSAP